MSFVLLGILNSQAASPGLLGYFLAVLGGGSSEFGRSVAVDSGDNVYLFGSTSTSGAGGEDLLLAKYDSSGTIQFQRTLGGADLDRGNSVAIDSSDNVYVLGFTFSAGGFIEFLLAKYNSSGTLQFQRTFGGVGNEQGFAVAIDSADNVYVVGNDENTKILIAKYNSSGTLQFQRILSGAGTERARSVAIDSGDNVYVLGRTDSTGAGGRDLLLAKYNSSGTIQFQRVLGGASDEKGYSVAVDSSDNVYVLGETKSTGAGGNDLLLAKYDSSGSIQFQRVLGGASSDIGNSVAIDSSDNVYVLGQTGSAGEGSNDFLLAKYNSSGTLQFQRTFGGVGNDIGNSIAIDSLGNLYLCGVSDSTGAGGNDFILAQLPNDGSAKGTYSLDGNNIIYQASTLTAATSTLTAGTASLSASTPSLTSATASLTAATSTLTSVTLEI